MGIWIILAAVFFAIALVLIVAEVGRCPQGGEHRPECRPGGYYCTKCGLDIYA